MLAELVLVLRVPGFEGEMKDPVWVMVGEVHRRVLEELDPQLQSRPMVVLMQVPVSIHSWLLQPPPPLPPLR